MAAKEARRGEKISVRVCNKMCSLKLDFYAKQTTPTIERPPAVIVRYINIHAEHLDVKYNGNNRYYAADCFVNSRPIFARLLWRIYPRRAVRNVGRRIYWRYMLFWACCSLVNWSSCIIVNNILYPQAEIRVWLVKYWRYCYSEGTITKKISLGNR